MELDVLPDDVLLLVAEALSTSDVFVLSATSSTMAALMENVLLRRLHDEFLLHSRVTQAFRLQNKHHASPHVFQKSVNGVPLPPWFSSRHTQPRMSVDSTLLGFTNDVLLLGTELFPGASIQRIQHCIRLVRRVIRTTSPDGHVVTILSGMQVRSSCRCCASFMCLI